MDSGDSTSQIARPCPLVLLRDLLDTAEVVTLRTWAFAISFIQSNSPVAQALICPEAKYVAVRWQDGRLDRRHVPAALWPGLEQDLARDLVKEPVSRSSLISTVLVGSMGALMQVAFVEVQAVRVAKLEEAEYTLDASTESKQLI